MLLAQFTLDTSYPAPCFLSNNLSALRHPDFGVHAISELLVNGCIVEHSEPPFCINPLPVAVGKMLHLVTDLRNVYCHLVRFKSIGTRTFARSRRFFRKGISSLPGT